MRTEYIYYIILKSIDFEINIVPENSKSDAEKVLER